MKFDDRYRRKIPLYARGRCDGPSTYTYKKDGFRLHWLGGGRRPCNFCDKMTNWGVTYFYPDERFKKWDKRDASTYHICEEEELSMLKAQILENKINKSRELNFAPRSIFIKQQLKKMRRK